MRNVKRASVDEKQKRSEHRSLGDTTNARRKRRERELVRHWDSSGAEERSEPIQSDTRKAKRWVQTLKKNLVVYTIEGCGKIQWGQLRHLILVHGGEEVRYDFQECGFYWTVGAINRLMALQEVVLVNVSPHLIGDSLFKSRGKDRNNGDRSIRRLIIKGCTLYSLVSGSI